MRSRLLKFPLLFLLCSLCACQSFKHRNTNSATAEAGTYGKQSHDLRTRNNSLALLNDLLNDEKNLSKILIVKSASPGLKQLVKNISETAGKGADLLKTLMKENPDLHLPGNGLPPDRKS